MIIKLLEDNTVHVKYSDGTAQALNSTYSHKALTPVVKAVCDAFPYKGAMDFTDYEAPVFVFDNCADCPEVLKTAMGSYYTELLALKAGLDGEEDVQATEEYTVEEEVVEVIDGKAVHTTKTVTKEHPLFDELPCVDANGDDICDEHGEPMGHQVPRMVLGQKVSDADKARLAELLGNL
tara:strand:+ start:5033 stop:5569 length:537 start_codon:yes stop_codon:yes gene_type:complete